jgi:pSer/pThr/pTyr-binding forkhead associated (FHA) protein
MAGNRGADERSGSRAGAGGEGLDADLDRAIPSGAALAYLVLVAGEQPGRVFVLNRNTVIIGRLDSADVSIGDASVSTRHARIINGSRGFEIEDLGSTNGTVVAGQRITRAPLRNGDRVTIGSVELTFLVDRPTAATVQLPMTGRSSALVATGATLIRPGNYAPRSSPIPAPPQPRARSDEDEGMSLAEIVERLARLYMFLKPRLPGIALCLAICLVLGFASSFILPPRSAAACVVKLLPEIKANPVEDQYHAPDDQAGQPFFQAAERSFVEPELVRSALVKVEHAEPSEAHLASVTSRLKLDAMGDHLYRASFTDKMIGRGAPAPLVFLPAHVRVYIQSEIDHALREFNAKVNFLRDQLKSVDKDLSHIDEERTRFREANADRLPEDAVQTHSSMFQLGSRRADLVAQVRRLQADLDAARLQVQGGRPLAQTKYQSSQTYRDSLAIVNRKLSEAYASGLADGHPEVQQLKAEKERLDALVKNELEAHATQLDQQTDPAFQAVEGRIESLQAQLAAARSDLGDTETNLAQVRNVVGALPRVEQRVVELNNAQDATTKLRSQLFDKLKQAELQLNLEQVSVQSRYDIGPIRLERPALGQTLLLRCILGLCLGLFIAIAWLLIREGRRLLAQAMLTLNNAPRPPRAPRHTPRR